MPLICVHNRDGKGFYLPSKEVAFTVAENPQMESSVPEGEWREFVVDVYHQGKLVVADAMESEATMVALLDEAGIYCYFCADAGTSRIERAKF